MNGGIQPCFSILFSELLKVFQQPVINQNDINLYSGLFVAIGVCAFIANTVQVSSDFHQISSHHNLSIFFIKTLNLSFSLFDLTYKS